MNLVQALQLVMNEAQSSALGDNNQEVLDAVELIEDFYEEYGHQFEHFSQGYDITKNTRE